MLLCQLGARFTNVNSKILLTFLVKIRTFLQYMLGRAGLAIGNYRMCPEHQGKGSTTEIFHARLFIDVLVFKCHEMLFRMKS